MSDTQIDYSQYNDFNPNGNHNEDYFDPIKHSWLYNKKVESNIYLDGATGKFYTEDHSVLDDTKIIPLTLINKYVLNWEKSYTPEGSGMDTEFEEQDEPSIVYPIMAWENSDDATLVCDLMTETQPRISANPGHTGRWFISVEKLPINYPQDNVFTYSRTNNLDPSGQAEIDHLNDIIAGLQTQLSQALDQAHQADAEKNQAVQDLTNAQVQIATLTSELGDANTTITNLTAENTTLAQEYQQANAQYLQYYNLYLTTDGQLQTAQGQIITLQSQVQELTAQNQALTIENQQLNAEITTLNAQIEALQTQVTNLEAQVGILQQQVQDAQNIALDCWQKMKENGATIASIITTANSEATGVTNALNGAIGKTFNMLGLNPTAGVPTLLIETQAITYWQGGSDYPTVSTTTQNLNLIQGWTQGGAVVSIADPNFYDPAHVLTNSDGSGKLYYNIEDFFELLPQYIQSLGYSSVSAMGQAIAGLQSQINDLNNQIQALQIKAGYWDTVKVGGSKTALFTVASGFPVQHFTTGLFADSPFDSSKLISGVNDTDIVTNLYPDGAPTMLSLSNSQVHYAGFTTTEGNIGGGLSTADKTLVATGDMTPYAYPDQTTPNTDKIIPRPGVVQSINVQRANVKALLGVVNILALNDAGTPYGKVYNYVARNDPQGFKESFTLGITHALNVIKRYNTGDITTGMDYANWVMPDTGVLTDLTFPSDSNVYKLLQAINGVLTTFHITDQTNWTPATFVYANTVMALALGVISDTTQITNIVTFINGLDATIINEMITKINAI